MKQHSSTKFGNNLRRLRELQGLSMDEFCEKYNNEYGGKLNKSTVSRYETGKQESQWCQQQKKLAIFSK